MGQLLAPGLANHSRLLKVTLVACQDDGGIAPGMRLDLSTPAHRAASHSICASDTDHPTQTTQYECVRHRTSHTDNTAHGLQTQTQNIPHRQHSTCVSQTQNIPHSMCTLHRHRTSHTDNTAHVHKTQRTQHACVRHRPRTQHMYVKDKNTAHVIRHRPPHTENTAHVYHTQRTQHGLSDTDTEHSMCCQTQMENTKCVVRHRHRDHSMCASDTDREHSMCCQTQRTQYVCVSDTENTAHVVRHRQRSQYI